MVARVDKETGVEHGLGQFLDEQRNAFGVGQDLAGDLRRHGLATRHAIHDRRSLIGSEAIERQRGYMRKLKPARLKFGSKGYDQERPHVLQAIDQHIQPFAGRRIDPVRILDKDDDGLTRCQRLDLLDEGGKSTGLLRGRRQLGGRVSASRVDRQQRRQQRNRFRAVRNDPARARPPACRA